MSNRKQQVQERAARVAAMRAEQERKDRRRKWLIFGTSGAVALALVAAVAVPLVNHSRERAAIEAAANAPIDGVKEFSDLGRDHVEGTVDYATTPPVGGDHNAVWQNCGIYDTPVTNEHAVHSLEHGAVWITYNPDLPADQVAALRDAVQGDAYAMLSPYEGLDSPIVMSAWGYQLKLDDAADERIDVFLQRYLQGEQTPEPGAACSGGVGTPVA
ncbi:DUF3105 domain-containing protein [Georgenia thermotolerans]|uniref:DUF3105 domain-containing protein n=1 Tax=Georgenia thermotolerans TaxID=527326 RepID=A0A7J5UTH2_9MICO|nr:DUF3105 domain-containing protein [Georgenia thermotolerans]KAE8765583.1 DUF3105 domain-containing protein [Georgenia thermotolerans]